MSSLRDRHADHSSEYWSGFNDALNKLTLAGQRVLREAPGNDLDVIAWAAQQRGLAREQRAAEAKHEQP